MATVAASSEESENLKHVYTQCYKAATKKCNDCCGAPNADQSIVDTQWYCGTECQKADWINHKSGCRVAQTRKMLYRAGQTLQMAICMYREKLFDLLIESVERRDGDIVLVEGWYDNEDLFFPFPSSLFHDEDEKRAVLLFQCCDDAPVYMYKLILMMLQGICFQIFGVGTADKNRAINLTRRFANNAIDKNEDAHFVIKAVLKNGDIYALDLTGAQYGHFDPVLPWQKYVESRASEVRTLVPLDQVRIRNNLRCEESGREGLVISANAFATSQMEQALGKWVSENLPLEAMLNLPDDSFKQKRAELLGVLKATLQDFKTSLTLEDVLKARLKFIEEGRFFYPL